MIKDNLIRSLLIAFLTFIPFTASAQLFTLPNLTGVSDMIITSRCLGNGSTRDPNGTAVLPVIDVNGITIEFDTGDLNQTINLFTSHPHLVKLPSSVETGPRESNRIWVDIVEVTDPTMVSIRAKAQGEIFPGYIDEDVLMIYPRFEVDSVTVSPEKNVYLVGDTVTVKLRLNNPLPNRVDVPFATQPSAGPENDLTNMFGSDYTWTTYKRQIERTTNNQGFDLTFQVEWPDDLEFYNLPDYSVNFPFDVGYIRPEFCSLYRGTTYKTINLPVKNPFFSIKPLPIINPPIKKLL